MLTIKIHPPERLPDSGLMEQQFQVYKTELEVYFLSDNKLLPFVTRGQYGTWTAAGIFPGRLQEAKAPAPKQQEDGVAVFAQWRELMLSLSLIAKTVLLISHH